MRNIFFPHYLSGEPKIPLPYEVSNEKSNAKFALKI